ncbi:hypothetical protein MMC28_007841 [Mycoblastus sanguinarius]|nr:hypothetical protein [Mycoblastus sanguinarius]
MSRLLKLPNEILHHIADKVTPDDITNFSLCCKEVHTLAWGFLQEHRERKRTYTDVVLGGCHRHEDKTHPLNLMRDIYMDHKIRYYPRSLSIECCEFSYEDEEGEEDSGEDSEEDGKTSKSRDRSFIQNIMKDFGNDILNSIFRDLFNNDSRMVKIWQDDIKDGNRVAMFSLLLARLRNLESISITHYSWSADSRRYLPGDLARSYLDGHPRGFRGLKPLPNLTHVSVYGPDDEHRLVGARFSIYEHFVALPSLRSIYGEFIAESRWFQWSYPAGISLVTEITLQKSAIQWENFDQLLKGIKALKRFTYDYFAELDDESGTEICEILAVLLKYARNSLEVLALTADTGLGAKYKVENNGCLRDFQVLKEARLSSYIFVKNGDEYKGLEWGSEYEEWKDDISRLADILPHTIEKVEFDGVVETTDIETLLKGLVECKTKRVPRLREIVFHEADKEPEAAAEIIKVLKEGCKAVGVTLEA